MIYNKLNKYLRAAIVFFALVFPIELYSAQAPINGVSFTTEEQAWLSEHPVIKISNNLSFVPIDYYSAGTPTGLSIDYLNLIASKLGLIIDYVRRDSWQKLIEMGRAKELDLLHAIGKNEKRSKEFAFSDQYFKIQTVNFGRIGYQRINSVDDLEGKKIGVVKGHILTEIYRQKHPDLNYFEFNNVNEALDALMTEIIDVFTFEKRPVELISTQNNINGIEVIGADFIMDGSAINLHFAAHKDNRILLDIINKGMATVTEDEFHKISEKWFGKLNDDTSNELTPEELHWLAENKLIKVSAEKSSFPFEFIDEEGRISGLSGDILNEIAKKLNVEFIWAGNESWNEGLLKIHSREADMVSGIMHTAEREKYLDFSDVYLNLEFVIISRNEGMVYTNLDTLDGKTVSQVKGTSSVVFLKENYPNINIVETEIRRDAYDLVSLGKVDALLDDAAGALANISEFGLDNLSIVGTTTYVEGNAIGVSSELPLLSSAIQKTLINITPEVRSEIFIRWLTQRTKENIDYGPLWLVIVITSLFGILILIWNRQLAASKKYAYGEKRGAEIAREEAINAKSVAENANETKSKFLASMSHELRTPLNAILGFAQMLKLDPKNIKKAKKDSYLDHILEGGNHLLELINNVLDLSAIEAHHFSINVEDVDVNKVFNDVLSSMEPLVNERNITVANNITEKISSIIKTDETRFKQCIYNLLSNAVKYNVDGGNITMDGNETGDGFYRISISDTGIGIAEDDYNNIFQMFQRIDESPHIASEGTGVGLAVTKLLVEQMSGRIGLDSKVGLGTTFWLEFPLSDNSRILVWSDELTTGVDAIDRDHQEVIRLINRLSQKSEEDETVDKVIEAVVDYTKYHFRREEIIMEVVGYTKIVEHKSAHRKLIEEMNKLVKVWEARRNSKNRQDLRTFLFNWWYSHITKVDIEIASYAEGKEVFIREVLQNKSS